MEKQAAVDAAQEILGFQGRMISGSKSAYARTYPDHVWVFNTNVCTRTHGKIWHGDLDVTIDESRLKALSSKLGEELFVLPELAGRFENEDQPLLDNARALVTAEHVELKNVIVPPC